jgi:hypothetical protein
VTVEGGDYTRARSADMCPLSDSVEGAAVQKYDSDGYVRNHFLNRDNSTITTS